MSRLEPVNHRAKPGVATESKLFWRAISGLIPVGALLAMFWADWPITLPGQIAISVGAVGWIIVVAISIRRTFIHQMRTLNTLIEAIRSEDYSLRGTLARETGGLAELYQQINSLTDELQQSRQDEKELRGLLERIITQFNVAVVAYDGDHRIVLANHLAEKLLQTDSTAMLGKPIKFYQLDRILPEQNSHLLEFSFPGARGRWQVSRQTYIHDGKQGNLIFIADLEQVLSEQEIKAWQRLIRVIAHEVNNSLTPITSLCQTLRSILRKKVETERSGEHDDLLEGLEVINERALNLRDFISDYARIARLPDAQKKQFDLLPLVARIRTIYKEDAIEFLTKETAALVYGDQTQIEQVLINLIKNAIEATADKKKVITIDVSCTDKLCRIAITDQGAGISNPANLFVPFYTTKPQGAGIGLALARRIAAAHNGDLQLQNREEAGGAIATLTLPLSR
ncbi:MAG: ATP-binding protein [Pseudomonadota bacterium]